MDDPAAMVRTAQSLHAQNRVPEAIAAYQEFLLRWPEHADSWYNLGLLLRQVRRFDDALVCYQQALALGISSPESVHLNRSVIFADYLRQDEAAERELEAALALKSAYIPALLNLANLYEDRGRRDDALMRYREVLALDPRCFEALARYANMHLPSDVSAELISNLRTAIADGGCTVIERSTLGFALGRLLDVTAAYDEAFDVYAAANRDSQTSAVSGTLRYNRQHHTQLVDRLIRASIHSTARAAADHRASATPPSNPQPIFVCGMFRSGSTLIEQLLASHRGIVAGGELDLLPADIVRQLAPFPEALSKISDFECDRLANIYLESLRKLFPAATRVTDKRPDNFLYIGLIKTLFPAAKIVHTTRDPLDNCLSIFFLHLDQRMSYASDLLDIAHYYREYRRLMAHWQQLYGTDIIEVNYDDYVREPQRAAAPLFDALGLQFDARYLAHANSGRSIKTASVWEVREPLYLRSSGRSEHYIRQLAPLRNELADLLP